MKHSTKILTASLLFSMAISSSAFAQQSIASAAPAYASKRIELPAENTNGTASAANAKTEASFAALFPKAANKLWAATGSNYYVSFLDNGRKANASFTAKGSMNYCITDCSTEQLPAAFSKTIQKEYAGYSLFKALEIKAYGAIAYQAVIENSIGFKTLKYAGGEVEEIQQVKK